MWKELWNDLFWRIHMKILKSLKNHMSKSWEKEINENPKNWQRICEIILIWIKSRKDTEKRESMNLNKWIDTIQINKSIT
jgi:hypothetical protein